MESLSSRYTDGDYLEHNPSWDMEDSGWKTSRIEGLLKEVDLKPSSICEVGCGAGGVLVELRRIFPDVELFGYDISPDAARFWKEHDAAGIHFEVGDFFQLTQRYYDVLLLLDVIEHLENPFEFLRRLRGHADLFIFHIPLDLSASNIIREKPLMLARSKTGHVHYFSKRLAFALLDDCGYEIITWRYTGAAFSSPKSSWKTRLASVARLLAYSVSKDWGVRLLGGETLMVLARARG
jgi:cyclopropane fatty-acyl-phospholipid synthase-like methyltransferase